MRKFLLTVGLIAAPTAVLAGVIPDTLLGEWQTDLANCGSYKATEGMRLDLWNRDGFGVMSEIDFATEGGGCEVAQVTGDNPYHFFANCCAEEAPEDASEFDIVLSADGQSMLDRDGAVTYHRCPE